MAELKWYEKASGKKTHKAENVAKLKIKGEAKKLRKTEKKDPKNPAPQKNKTAPESKRRRPAWKSDLNSLFDKSKIPSDALEILENFEKIVFETRALSSKQQALLPGQIKKLSHELTDDRGKRRLGYMNDASAVSAYIVYFMWWNLVRLTRLFSNMPENAFALEDGDACLDLGSGPLTVPVALWLSRPELRSKKLAFYCVDLSQTVLSAGEELYYSVAAKTLKGDESPWNIIRIKGTFGTKIRQTPKLVTCANVFNELAENTGMPSDYLAKKWCGEIESYFSKDENSARSVLIVEPADPHSARIVSLLRESFIRKGFAPVSPCPHSFSCPMSGRTSSNPGGKWCNFAFSTEDSPRALLKLSEKANLSKERAGLSFVFLQKNAGIQKIGPEKDKLLLRVASDFIHLPDLKKSGYYCCSELGLVLAVDKSRVCPANGELISVKKPESAENAGRDKKSGAVIIEI